MSSDFITSVELPKNEAKINYTQSIMLLGSCFSEHIGQLLADSKFSCDINPFGVLYNPTSIEEALIQILKNKRYKEESPELIEYNGWHSLMHHSTFSAINRDECLEKINTRINNAHHALPHTDILFLTFGSAYIYRWKENNMIVGNCHKLPENKFIRELIEVDDIVHSYSFLIPLLLAQNPAMKFIFTVSPIRHKKDGMHQNQLSKSTLLLGIKKIIEEFPKCCFYFPAYEIMMDELRDYRFYADDMIHPSPLAISYIWKCFKECYFSPESLQTAKEWEDIRKMMKHKPFNTQSEQYKQFLSQLVLRIEQLKRKYPNFNIEKEIALCHTLLNK